MHTSIALMEICSWTIFGLSLAYKFKNKQVPKFALWPALVALTAVVGVSLALNPPLRTFWEQFGFMHWIFLFWGYTWAFEIIWTEAFEKHAVRVWAVALAAAAAYGVFECVTGLEFLRPHKQVLESLGRVYRATGFFSASLTYSYVMGLSTLALFLPASKAAPMRRWMWLSLIAGSLGVAASMSRGAALSLIACGFIYLLFRARRFLPYFIAGSIAAITALAAVSPNLNNTIHLRMEGSSNKRLDLWRAFGEMFKDHPVTGVGLFQGDKLLPQYYEKLGIQQEFTSHAHNVFIQWAAGTGIFGLLIYCGLSLWFLMAAWRLREKTPWGWSLFLGQIFWHLGSLSENNFFDGEVNHLIIFTWAIIVFWTRLQRGDEVRKNRENLVR